MFAATEMIEPTHHSPHPTRSRLAAGVAVVGLLAGGAGGYGLRWGTETPQTKTVTTTVTRVVAPPAFATRTTQTAYLTWTGTRGVYSGPTEFTTGTTLTIHFTGPQASGIVLATLADGTTWEQLSQDAATGTFQTAPSYLTDVAERVGSGDVTHQLTPGLYAVLCGASQTGHPSLAVMIRVVG